MQVIHSGLHRSSGLAGLAGSSVSSRGGAVQAAKREAAQLQSRELRNFDPLEIVDVRSGLDQAGPGPASTSQLSAVDSRLSLGMTSILLGSIIAIWPEQAQALALSPEHSGGEPQMLATLAQNEVGLVEHALRYLKFFSGSFFVFMYYCLKPIFPFMKKPIYAIPISLAMVGFVLFIYYTIRVMLEIDPHPLGFDYDAQVDQMFTNIESRLDTFEPARPPLMK